MLCSMTCGLPEVTGLLSQPGVLQTQIKTSMTDHARLAVDVGFHMNAPCDCHVGYQMVSLHITAHATLKLEHNQIHRCCAEQLLGSG